MQGCSPETIHLKTPLTFGHMTQDSPKAAWIRPLVMKGGLVLLLFRPLQQQVVLKQLEICLSKLPLELSGRWMLRIPSLFSHSLEDEDSAFRLYFRHQTKM